MVDSGSPPGPPPEEGKADSSVEAPGNGGFKENQSGLMYTTLIGLLIFGALGSLLWFIKTKVSEISKEITVPSWITNHGTPILIALVATGIIGWLFWRKNRGESPRSASAFRGEKWKFKDSWLDRVGGLVIIALLILFLEHSGSGIWAGIKMDLDRFARFLGSLVPEATFAIETADKTRYMYSPTGNIMSPNHPPEEGVVQASPSLSQLEATPNLNVLVCPGAEEECPTGIAFSLSFACEGGKPDCEAFSQGMLFGDLPRDKPRLSTTKLVIIGEEITLKTPVPTCRELSSECPITWLWKGKMAPPQVPFPTTYTGTIVTMADGEEVGKPYDFTFIPQNGDARQGGSGSIPEFGVVFDLTGRWAE